MKTIKKAQNGNNVKPDYRNIKKEKRTIKGSKEFVPTAKDSADYREGFENAVKKVRNTRIPKSSNYTRGQREAKERNLKLGGPIKKAQNGATKKPKLLTVTRTRQVADSLDYEGNMKSRAAKDRTIGTYVRDYKDAKGYDKIAQELNQSSIKDRDNATRYRKLADAAEKKLKSTPKKKAKTGATVSKAKDGKWIQKATASIKRRGTKGVCTGAKFGGPTCKPGSKRYNLAKTFKSIAKKKK
jgi:hypothetical protein